VKTEPFFLNVKFDIEDFNIEKFVSSISDEIYISGVINVNGFLNFKDKDVEMETTIKSVRKRGVKQIMNFGAVKVLVAMSGGNPIKSIGSSNFYYSKIGIKITLKNNYLTLEGLAGEKKNVQYMIKKSFLRQGINLTIDKKSNTIEISHFMRRIKNAIRRIKEGGKFKFKTSAINRTLPHQEFWQQVEVSS
ncbi:hypothetical protein J7L87_05385, partial [bacterium]|nr:hypothetical protein [bacterium]